MITAPVAAIGWPSAIAPPFGLTFSAVEAEVLDHGERLGGERLVQLDHVDVVERLAGPLERLAHGRHGADAHDLRVHAAVRVGEDPAAHGRAERSAASAPTSARRAAPASFMPDALPAVTVPSGLKTGLQLAHRLDVGVRAHVLVLGRTRTCPSSTFISTGTISSSKRPSSCARAARRCDSTENSSCSLAGDRVRLGEVLRGDAHVDVVERVGERRRRPGRPSSSSPMRAPQRASRHPVRAAAHRLGAAGDRDLGLAGLDRLRGGHDRLHAGAAEAVDGEGRRLLRDPRLHRRRRAPCTCPPARSGSRCRRRPGRLCSGSIPARSSAACRGGRAQLGGRLRPSGFLRSARRRCGRRR